MDKRGSPNLFSEEDDTSSTVKIYTKNKKNQFNSKLEGYQLVLLLVSTNRNDKFLYYYISFNLQ